jgi:hypothetical protein
VARLNIKAVENPSTILRTHEGAHASRNISNLDLLKRSVCSCLLFENTFYEDDETIIDRIINLVKICNYQDVADLAIKTRSEYNLRHISLLLARELSRHPNKGYNPTLISKTIFEVIQRADELSEFLSIYWKDGKQPLASQVKLGLAKAFTKFNEYELAKYNRKNKIKLKDVLFMCHAKPINSEQEELWKKLINNNLATPDTWEVALSGGKDKKETFERLLKENKLSYLALLKNLRNMIQVNVDEDLIKYALLHNNSSKILPFRYISAFQYAPNYYNELDTAMQKNIKHLDKLEGKTVILIDISGSMNYSLSNKSHLNRIDAAIGIAILINSLSNNSRVFIFGTECYEILAYKGLALKESVTKEFFKIDGGTDIANAINTVNNNVKNYDRLVIITDEQSSTNIPRSKNKKSYIINVSTYQNGIGYKDYIHINGFSENIIKFIQEYEKLN